MISTSSDHLALTIELSRAQDAGDPFAFRPESQTYVVHEPDGSVASADLEWTDTLAGDLASLRERSPDPIVIQRLGEQIRAFLVKAGWTRREAAIADAIERDKPVALTLRFAAAELYALPWELCTFEATGRHLGELPGLRIRYAWPGADAAPESPSPRRAGGRILVAWSTAGGAVPATDHIKAVVNAAEAGFYRFDPDRDVIAEASYGKLRDALEAAAAPSAEPIAAVHMLCHGSAIGQSFGLVLDSDEPGQVVAVDAGRLRALFADHAGRVRLVFLAACDGSNTGDAGNALGSVAQAIHRGGIDAVVGSRYPLSVKASVKLTDAFYRALLVDLTSVEGAFVAGRRQLARDPSRLDWAALTLQAHGHEVRPFVVAPYRGLLPFERRHARFFFGRDGQDRNGKPREVDELCADFAKLTSASESPRFLVVAGDSGTGKSSMVFSSAVPRLEKEGWIAQSLRPGSSPIPALKEALTALSEALAIARGKGTTPRGLLIVDQFEELFTSVASLETRTTFATRLWEFARVEGGPGVIVTVRIDFLGRCGELLLDKESGLRLDKVACDPAHQILVAQMDSDQLRAAIEEPARKVGLALEPGLTERILADVDQEPGALPLVQHTLTQLWARREGGVLTQAAYAAIGGVLGALNQHADGVIDDFERSDPEKARIARRLLIRLVNLGVGDSPNTRRRAPLDTLRPETTEGAARFDEVLRTLVDQRLLVRSGKGEKQTVEVAHESLIRKWARLGRWLAEERGTLLDREELRGWEETCTKRRTLLTESQVEVAQALFAQDAELVQGETRELMERSRAEIERAKEQARRFRDTLRVTVAREYLMKDPVVSMVLLRDVEARDPATVPTWYECAINAFRAPISVVLEGHTGGVRSAAWSPDGTRIVSVGRDESARLWDARTGEEIARLDSPTSLLAKAAWSLDGTKILIVSLTTVQGMMVGAWDLTKGELTTTLMNESDVAPVHVLSPDRTMIVFSAGDNAPRVRNALTGELISTLQGHEGQVLKAAWSPDSTRVITSSMDQTARVWDAMTGQPGLVRRSDRGPFYSIACSPDGTSIATVSHERAVRIWSAVTGEELGILQGDVADIFFAEWSPDGSTIATASSNKDATVWHVATKSTIVLRGHAEAIATIAFSPDNMWIVTASEDHTARVWDLFRREELLGELLLRNPGVHILSAAWSPDGRQILTTGGENAMTRVWSAETGEPLLSFEGHEGMIVAAAWSPDGTTFVTMSSDRTARTWSVATKEAAITCFPCPDDISWASFSRDARMVVTIATEDHAARVWNAATGEALATLELPEVGMIRAVFSVDGTRVATLWQHNRVNLWSVKTGEMQVSLEAQKALVQAMDWSPDGTKIVTAAGYEGAVVWSAATGQALLRTQGHGEPIDWVAWSPDGTRFVTAATDGRAIVWSAATGEALATLRCIELVVTQAAWSSDGTKIVTLTESGLVNVWGVDTGRLYDRLWQATSYSLSRRRRMQLLDEDAITAEANVERGLQEFARRRGIVKVREREASAPAPSPTAARTGVDAGAATGERDELRRMIEELRATAQSVDQKAAELHARLGKLG